MKILTKLLGGFLISSPFIAIFIYGIKTVGLKDILFCFLIASVTILIILMGVLLIRKE